MAIKISKKFESACETKEDFVTYCNLVKKALMAKGYGNHVAKALVDDHKNGVVRTGFKNKQDAEGVATSLDRYYANESYASERRDDYLQEIWDSLEPVWDKSKFDMKQGYDSEYDCDCITITSKDNDGVLAKIYVNDHDGKHPVGFDVVYRYPGDKGVGVMGSYEFQSTDMDGLGEEVFDYFDEIKKKAGESMKKSEVKDNEVPYVMMQYYVPNEKVWEPVLVEINRNNNGWFYDGLAPMDNLGNFGYDEFSWDFIHKRCKRGTDKCDPELVQSMEKFYLNDFTSDDKYQPRKVDRLGNHIPKGVHYVGKDESKKSENLGDIWIVEWKKIGGDIDQEAFESLTDANEFYYELMEKENDYEYITEPWMANGVNSYESCNKSCKGKACKDGKQTENRGKPQEGPGAEYTVTIKDMTISDEPKIFKDGDKYIVEAPVEYEADAEGYDWSSAYIMNELIGTDEGTFPHDPFKGVLTMEVEDSPDIWGAMQSSFFADRDNPTEEEKMEILTDVFHKGASFNDFEQSYGGGYTHSKFVTTDDVCMQADYYGFNDIEFGGAADGYASGTLSIDDRFIEAIEYAHDYGSNRYEFVEAIKKFVEDRGLVIDWSDEALYDFVAPNVPSEVTESDVKEILSEMVDSGVEFTDKDGNPADLQLESIQGESKKSEASRFGAGMSKRTNFTKVRNLGDILDVLKEHQEALEQASKDMSRSKEDIDAIIKKLNEFDGYMQVLKQQSIKGIKKSLAIKNSPEVQAASEVEKALKGALSIIADNYRSVPDIKALMTVIDSRYSTTGSRVLTTVEGQVSRAIEVDYKTIKDSIASGDVSEDDVLTFATMTSISHGVKDKGVATKLQPVLERMNAMVESATRIEEAVIDPKQFKELRDYVEQLVKEASEPKDTIKTAIVALDKDTIASVPTESLVSEGLLDKITNIVNAIRGKVSRLWDKFKSMFFELEDDALESADVFADVEVGLAMVGVTVAESRDRNTLGAKFEVLTKSVLTCCDKLAKDASLAGEFDDEVIYAEDAVKNAVESFHELGHACESLKHVLSCHKNEDNMNVIGILADAITQIVADDETPDTENGDKEDAEDEDSMSVIDQVEREYAPSEEPEGGEEGSAAPNPADMGAPEEF